MDNILEAEQFKERLKIQEKRIVELEALVKYYEELYRLNQHRKFGSSSEKTHPEQLSLFDEAENEADKHKPEPTVEQVTYTRRRGREKQEEETLPDLPVETVEHVLPEAERVCPECSFDLHVMGRDTRRELKVTNPRQSRGLVFVNRSKRSKNLSR